MGILTDDMKRVVSEQKLGFVATVCADGTPNLSPKGTMLTLDDDSIMFAEIRSPATVANLRANDAMEINFIDPFARKGYRFKGRAHLVEADADEFKRLIGRFDHFGALARRIKRLVILEIEKAAPLSSPIYDIGGDEADLRRHWRAYFDSLEPG